MFISHNKPLFGFVILVACLVGCKSTNQQVKAPASSFSPIDSEPLNENELNQLAPSDHVANEFGPNEELNAPLIRPLTSESLLSGEFRELTLDEAIHIAINGTKILRSLSATVVQNPDAMPSSFDPAIQATDPNFGIEAALSKFDTNFNATALYSSNDDFFNNPTTTGGAFEVQEDVTNLTYGLSKRAATGTFFQITSNTIHNNTSNPAVLFPNSWTTNWEATVRHPFLQGSGVLFNQIAGPDGRPGFGGSSGVLIARSNHKISMARFERNLQDMVEEVIDAYWQLDLAYKNLKTVRAARNASLETWNIAYARFNNGLPGGEADREAQAREQCFLFESLLKQSLNGSQANGAPGILQAEANLRRLLDLPRTETTLLLPTETPSSAPCVFSWESLVDSTLSSRVEIKEQRQRVKQQELLLLASRDFTRPRFDGIATYRNNGFGDDLIGGSGKFAGAINEAASGNYDEWEFGVNVELPIGFRQAHSGVRNSELKLSRQRAILKELKKQILHELGSTLRRFDQSLETTELAWNRRCAAAEMVGARTAAYAADFIGFEDLLEAQERKLQAELAFHRSRADRELALESLRSESGKLLQVHQIYLAENGARLNEMDD